MQTYLHRQNPQLTVRIPNVDFAQPCCCSDKSQALACGLSLVPRYLPDTFDIVMLNREKISDHATAGKNNKMKNMIRKLILILLVCSSAVLRAQFLDPTVVAGSGGYFSNSSASLSWTLGEVVTETVTDGQNILTQGFQQPEILITQVGANDSANALSVYPNPSSDFINITFQQPVQGAVLIELFSMDGQLVYSSEEFSAGAGGIFTVNMRDFASGIYMLKVTVIGQEIPSIFKVQKTN